MEVGSDEKLHAVAALIERSNELIRFFEHYRWPIIKIQTVHKADKSTWNQWALKNNVARLIEGSREAEYSPDVHTAKHEIYLTKTRTSAFIRTDLDKMLRNLDCRQIILCGYSTNVCVGQTAIDAYEYDYEVILAGEAILGTNVEEGDQMLEYLDKRYDIQPISNRLIIERFALKGFT